LEILALRVVAHRPRTARIQPLDHDQQAGLQPIAAEHGVGAVHGLQLLDEARIVVTGAQESLTEEAALKDAGPELDVLAGDLVHRPADGERRGDDRASGRAGDQIEIVAQAEAIVVAVPRPKLRLDAREDAEREDASQPAAVEREDALRTRDLEVLCDRAPG